MTRSALIDPTGTYRYTLTREWEPSLGRACFIMLNPSTADATKDDPTIRRCIAFARTWGYGGLEVVNLFAYRATSPADLWPLADPVGTENDAHIADAVRRCHIVVAAWGVHGEYRGRGAEVASRVLGLMCLGTTKGGHPRHPLYVRGDTLPVAFGGQR